MVITQLGNLKGLRIHAYVSQMICGRNEKTCLQEISTRSGKNWPVNPQRPAKLVNFRIAKQYMTTRLFADLHVCCSPRVSYPCSSGVIHIVFVTGILFLVSVSRIASIHINVNEIVDRIQTASQLNTPWSVVLCGIGAGLALASALALCLGTLREERTWKQFDFDVTLTTTDKGEERYADITQMAHENKAYEPGTVENSEV